MALTDIVTNANNISIIIEIVTIVLIVLSFFRWYDKRYSSMVTDTKQEVLERIHDIKETLCNQIKDINNDVNRLEDYFYRRKGWGNNNAAV